MISVVRMCDKVQVALVRRQRAIRRLEGELERARRANRALRARLGIAQTNERVSAKQLREFRRMQRRLPL